MPSITVAICTRNRPERLARTLAALDRQRARNFSVVVVDQGDAPDPDLERREAADRSFVVVRDEGRGLSRARNLAVNAVSDDWIAFVDDDCLLEPDWTGELADAISRHPEVDYVSGNVAQRPGAQSSEVPIATMAVTEERLLSGRRPPATSLGFGVCMAARRSTIERLGGWDERLGAGAPHFPAADDVDFNHRLLRSGAVALVTPRLRAVHEQWRDPRELAVLLRGYTTADGGLAAKHVKTGDIVGGARLWGGSAFFVAWVAVGALRARSRMRLGLAGQMLRGLVGGTIRGLATKW